MGHEDSRKREAAEELSKLRPHLGARKSVESRERLVEQEHCRIPGERAREGDALSLTSGELRRARFGQPRDPKALEQLVHPPPPTEADVAANGQVRKEGVLLEHEAHPPPLRRDVDAGACVEPGLSVQRDAPELRTKQARDHAQDARLPRARRTDEGERLFPDAQLEIEGERAKGMSDV